MMHTMMLVDMLVAFCAPPAARYLLHVLLQQLRFPDLQPAVCELIGQVLDQLMGAEGRGGVAGAR